MNDFIANKIIDDFIHGNLSPVQAWKNISESKDVITDEKYDELCSLISERLVDLEEVSDDEDVDLERFFSEKMDEQSGWFDEYYGKYDRANDYDEDDWTSGNDVY